MIMSGMGGGWYVLLCSSFVLVSVAFCARLYPISAGLGVWACMSYLAKEVYGWLHENVLIDIG